ncbi:MAG TPA: hypothetical protein P5089_00955 [Candidatus Portnoybacteria bacterium]|nr:hypothetical protein [Candidatus Portnoybacteria bacterium]
MSKKIIIISVAVFLILAAGGFCLYKNNLLPFVGDKLTPEKLLASFENKNPNLSAETFRLFQERFNETKDALQKNADNFDRWLYLGVLKKGIGDYEGARDVFIYAGQIRPKSSTPFANLADLYAYFLNEPQKAEASIKQAIANAPNDYSLYLSLADIYRYKFDDGADKYEQVMLEAIAKLPDNANLIAPLAAFYRDANQAAKAIEWYEKLAKLLPDNAEVKKDLAELKAKQ